MAYSLIVEISSLVSRGYPSKISLSVSPAPNVPENGFYCNSCTINGRSSSTNFFIGNNIFIDIGFHSSNLQKNEDFYLNAFNPVTSIPVIKR